MAQPSYRPGTATWQQQEDETVGLETDIARKLALHNEYRSWSDIANFASMPPSPDPNMQGDIKYGRVPVIALTCQDDITTINGRPLNLVEIANGDADADIAAVAKGLATLQYSNGYPYPVMLRYFWEFNLNAVDLGKENGNDCFIPPGTVMPQPASPFATAPSLTTQFTAAWQRIHDVLTRDTTPQNITWVWNPHVQGETDGEGDPVQAGPFDGFWPGQNYVDWIAGDGYSLYQAGDPVSFRGVFDGFITDIDNNSQYSGMPLMIAETGACNDYPYPGDQAGYVAAAEKVLNSVPPPGLEGYGRVHAFEYFDGQSLKYKWNGNNCDWSLDGPAQPPDPAGMAAFKAMAKDPYFAPMVPTPTP